MYYKNYLKAYNTGMEFWDNTPVFPEGLVIVYGPVY